MKQYISVIIQAVIALIPICNATPQGVCGLHLPGAPAGMGLCGTAVAAGSGAVFYNPAATGCGHRFDCSSGFGRPFGMASISAAAVSAGCRGNNWQVCAGWNRIGNNLYREESLLLACGVQMVPGISIGVAAETEQEILGTRDRRVRVSGTAGLLCRVLPGIRAGCAVTLGAGRTTGILLPRLFRAGISFSGKGALCCCDYIQRNGEAAELHAGGEIPAGRFLSFKAGVVHNPSLLTAGMTVRRGPIMLAYSVTIHPQLGETHSFSISVTAGSSTRDVI